MKKYFLIALLVAIPTAIYVYGSSIPEEHEFITSGVVTPEQAPVDPWALLTRPDTWPTLFPYIERTERLSRPFGEKPHYKIHERNFISYTVQIHEDLEHHKVRWEIADSRSSEGSFAEAEVLRVDRGYSVKITEHVKIRPPILRAIYQIFKGYDTNTKALEKLFQKSSMAQN